MRKQVNLPSFAPLFIASSLYIQWQFYASLSTEPDLDVPPLMATKILTLLFDTGLEHDCKDIHDSWGRTSNRLVHVLADRNQIERRQMREIYNAIYGEDLVGRLEMFNMEEQRKESINTALSLWMLDSHERDAVVARESVEPGNPNYKALIEIFVGRKSSQIFLIKQAYQARFKRQLDQDIINIDPPHSFQKILVALAASHKAHKADISQHIAKCDARRLYETREGSSGSMEEAVVLEMLSKRSVSQLKHTFSCYQHIYGHDFTKSLKMRNCGEFENALHTVVKCIDNPPKYYAKMLFTSIEGEATDKRALERVLLSRAEVDLDEIQRVFRGKYGIDLKEAICERISCGDYRDFLVALATKANC